MNDWMHVLREETAFRLRILAEVWSEMARWRRRPEPGMVVHADRGAQYNLHTATEVAA